MKKNTEVFKEFYTNQPGTWFFTPEEDKNFHPGLPAKGFGSICYDEGSVYTGDIYYDGRNFNKLGRGIQDFSLSSLSQVDPVTKERIYLYAGRYDYRKTDWIYGNGVLYFTDRDFNPTHYVKAFFNALEPIKPYVGNFSNDSLMKGYTPSMERKDYHPRRDLLKKELGNNLDSKTIFIGDSYFEFWNYPQYCKTCSFTSAFPSTSFLNLGLGGSTFLDWSVFVLGLKKFFNDDPQKLVINLGFNDLNIISTSVKSVLSCAKKVIALIHKCFPKTVVYLNTVVSAPFKPQFWKKIQEYNDELRRLAKTRSLILIDVATIFDGYKNKDYLSYFYLDHCHLNESGYAIFSDIIKQELNK